MAECVCKKATIDDDLAKYQQDLNNCLYSDSTAIFSNYCQAHAKCIIRSFFDAARESIEFLSGDFGADVFCKGPIHNSIVEAVRRGVRVRVISLNTDEKSKACVDDLSRETAEAANGGKGSFGCVFSRVRDGARIQHYMVVDRKRYRLESCHPDHQVDNVHAEVCCNGPAKAATLCGMFDDIWYFLSEKGKAARTSK